jgi:DNA-binding NtrC family response regulator
MRGDDERVRRLDVLLVDGDAEVRGPMADGLRERHEVRVAMGLRDAIDELVRRVPDVVVCDFELTPYRGDVFLSMVAREHPQVRCVLYTDSLPPPGTAALVHAAHVVLIKPTTIAELLAAIDGDD